MDFPSHVGIGVHPYLPLFGEAKDGSTSRWLGDPRNGEVACWKIKKHHLGGGFQACFYFHPDFLGK